LLASAGKVVSRTLGGDVILRAAERLTDEHRRNRLLRCRVESGLPGCPETLVIKRTNLDDYRPDDPASWPAQGLFRDWAGLQFLNEAAGRETGCPRFYGGDRENGFVVMEDLGVGEDLANRLLHGTAESAEAGLLLLAGVLGRMHAVTLGREADYLRIRGALSEWREGGRSESAKGVRETKERIAEVCSGLEVEVGDAFAADVETVAKAIEEPGPFLAYTHGDPCPDNTLLRGNDLRLFDYEFGGYRHALLDGVYGRIRFPTCWCVGDIPESVVERMEVTYRKELAAAYPAVEDDAVYGKAIVEACGSWLLGNLGGMLPGALEKDGDWGIASLRQRLLKRMEVFVGLSEKTGRLEGLREVAENLLERLRLRWDGEVAPLPLYPAFASSEG
jgi:hypothetical protein